MKREEEIILDVMLLVLPCVEINGAGTRYHKAISALIDASTPGSVDIELLPGLKQTLMDAVRDLRKTVEKAENEMLHRELRDD